MTKKKGKKSGTAKYSEFGPLGAAALKDSQKSGQKSQITKGSSKIKPLKLKALF